MAEGMRAGARMIGWLALGLFALFCARESRPSAGRSGLGAAMWTPDGNITRGSVRQPGLLLALPYPIDEVIRVPVKQEREIAITALRDDAAAREAGVQGLPGYALSGNQSILEADMTLKYRISDPIAYTFSNRTPDRILRDTVIGAASEVIAQWQIDDALRLQP